MAKNTGKVREFCQSGKVGTLNEQMLWVIYVQNFLHYFLGINLKHVKI